MISRVDDQLGRVLRAVSDTGADARTLKLFFTDHGEYLGDYGLVEKWPSGLDDCLLRNPLIVAGPDVAEGARCDAMVEMVDLLPTLAEVCGLTVAHTHFGKSFTPQLAGSAAPHKPAVFAEGGFTAAEEHLLETAGFPYDVKAGIQHEAPIYCGRAMSIRTPEWTYIHRLYEAPELYDRKTDPGETLNRAGEPGLAAVEQALRDQVLTWFMETSDVIPWQGDPRY
jgi:arylsulfatase A-like enzyme